MTTRSRLCSECGESIAGKKTGTKTCSAQCRSTRSRRLRGIASHAEAEARLPAPLRGIREAADGRRDDVVERVLTEELRPVVREAITENTMRAIEDLVALTPAAVSALKEDMASEDSTIRQRAYTLLIKYTVGHTAIVRPPEEEADKKLVVNFNIPTADTIEAPEVHVTEELEAKAEEVPALRETSDTQPCDMCERDLPLEQFVAGSLRCKDCFDAQQAKAASLFQDG